MANLIAGLVGALLICLFLGGMVVGIGVSLGWRSLPLVIIVGIVLAMVWFDFVQTVRKGRNRSGA